MTDITSDTLVRSFSFQPTDIIGEGAFGRVYKGRHVLDGQVYAIKKVTCKDKQNVECMLREVRSLATLYHPNIIRYYNCWIEK